MIEARKTRGSPISTMTGRRNSAIPVGDCAWIESARRRLQ
jgi:hypothetical protein